MTDPLTRATAAAGFALLRLVGAVLHHFLLRDRLLSIPHYIAIAAFAAGTAGWYFGITAAWPYIAGAAGVLAASLFLLQNNTDRAIIGGQAASVVAWVTAATVFRAPWDPAMLSTLAVSWIGGIVYWRRHRSVRLKIRERKVKNEFGNLAANVGDPSAHLVRSEIDPDVPENYTIVTETPVGGTHPDETWGNARKIQMALPAGTERASVETTDDGHVRRRVIHVQGRDRWATEDPPRHPALTHPDLWRPCSATIHEPRPIGVRPDGKLATVVIWSRDEGAHRMAIGGDSGTGKTVTTNDLMMGLLPCKDVLRPWIIDVGKKGRVAAAWAGACDWIATSQEEALEMLYTALAIKDGRAERAAELARYGIGESKIIPTFEVPLIPILVDEGSRLFQHGALASRCSEAGKDLAQTVRSEGIALFIVAQKWTVDMLGVHGAALRKELNNSISMRCRNPAEGRFLLGDNPGVDVSTFRHKGEMAIRHGSDNPGVVTRAWHLDDIPDIYALAQRYGNAPAPTLEAGAIADAGEAYARRSIPAPAATPGGGTAPARRGRPSVTLVSARGGGSAPAADGMFSQTLAEHETLDEESLSARLQTLATLGEHTVASTAAALRDSREPWMSQPYETLPTGQREPETDTGMGDEITMHVIQMLSRLGQAGAAISELWDDLPGAGGPGRSLATLGRRLADLCSARLIVAVGDNRARRYYLANLAPKTPTADGE